MHCNIKRVMIAGTKSGSGKTTIVCGILKALKNRGLNPCSFKCGPDYIDTMFHKKAINVVSNNIDSFMVSEKYLKYLFAKNSIGFDISIIEGVMGFYDGLSDNSGKASSNDISIIIDAPVIIVVDCKGMAPLSCCAIIQGFKNFRKNKIKACILNNVSKMTFNNYKDIIEKNVNIDVIGYMPAMADISILSRNLGLIMPNEIKDIKNKIEVIAEQVNKSVDLDYIINLSNCKSFACDDVAINKICNGIKVAIAYDDAFCFYYNDNFELIKKLGAEIVFFSPINDNKLPDDINAVIIGGGYPELYLRQLSENISMLNSIKNFVLNGGKCIAECGGFMYLHEEIENYKMVGVIRGRCFMTKKLNRFGYITLKSKNDNIMCSKGEIINAHEFHYSDSDNNGEDFKAVKVTGRQWDCIIANKNLFAGYPHINYWGNINFITNFIKF